jgi:hypothetical protein
MAKKLKKNKWYVVRVEVPGGQDVTAGDLQEFVGDLAKKLSRRDGVRAQSEKPDKDAPPAPRKKAGVVPMYVCHGKF